MFSRGCVAGTLARAACLGGDLRAVAKHSVSLFVDKLACGRLTERWRMAERRRSMREHRRVTTAVDANEGEARAPRDASPTSSSSPASISSPAPSSASSSSGALASSSQNPWVQHPMARVVSTLQRLTGVQRSFAPRSEAIRLQREDAFVATEGDLQRGGAELADSRAIISAQANHGSTASAAVAAGAVPQQDRARMQQDVVGMIKAHRKRGNNSPAVWNLVESPAPLFKKSSGTLVLVGLLMCDRYFYNAFAASKPRVRFGV